MIACTECGANLLDETAVCPVCQTPLLAAVKKKRLTPTPSQQRNRLLLSWLIYLVACAILKAPCIQDYLSTPSPASHSPDSLGIFVLIPLLFFHGVVLITLVVGFGLIVVSFIVLATRKASRPDTSLSFVLLGVVLLLMLNTLPLFFVLYGIDWIASVS